MKQMWLRGVPDPSPQVIATCIWWFCNRTAQGMELEILSHARKVPLGVM